MSFLTAVIIVAISILGYGFLNSQCNTTDKAWTCTFNNSKVALMYGLRCEIIHGSDMQCGKDFCIPEIDTYTCEYK